MKKLSQLKSKMAEISQKMQSFHSKIQIVSKEDLMQQKPCTNDSLKIQQNTSKTQEKNKNSSKKLEN